MIKLNGNIITPTIFPDKTSQVWKTKPLFPYTVQTITWDFESEAEVMQIAQLKMLLDTQAPMALKQLDMSYLPYARQDKDISNESTFALHSFAHVINSLNFNKVTALDTHSKIASTLIKNFEDIFPDGQIGNALNEFKPDIIVFPDKGACARYGNFFALPIISIDKERNQTTGALTIKGIVNPSGIDLAYKRCLIVDDLCDGGGTFILAANALYNEGIKEVGLYTTHGIYSKGTKVLKDNLITRIFNMNGEVL